MKKALITTATLIGLTACGGGGGEASSEAPAANKPATFSGQLSASATTETNSISGTAIVSDANSGEAQFRSQTVVATQYGKFTINANGTWYFEINRMQSDVAKLSYATESLTENVTLTSLDGSTTTLAIKITGVENYPASFAGDLTAQVNLSNGDAAGKTQVTDPDDGEAVFQTSAEAQYGSFTINQAGEWSYSLNKAHNMFSSWTSKQDSTTDLITLISADGSTTELMITINGVDKAVDNDNQALIFFNETRLKLSKQAIAANNQTYVDAYQELIKLADKELNKAVDPVTNKTLLPASGDIHDYYSIGPYYWPNPDTDDGLPWVYRDGEYNSKTNNGPDADYKRRNDMLNALEILNLAFYFSEDLRYLEKAKEIVKTWFVDDATKMNPNVNHGSAVPGKSDGSGFGILQWNSIGNVITSVQLIEKNNLWTDSDSQTMQQWFDDYYTWLTTSELGIFESTRSNNHGTNYDHQALGLQIYLGKIADAEAQIDITKSRIDSQIAADGSQPEELRRSKSVNYTVNNLWALTRIADLGARHTNNDLWAYTNSDGVSLKTVFDFVIPYFDNPTAWKWKQITGGGVEPSLQNLALPMFARAELMLGKEILPSHLDGTDKFTALEVLTYAP
ncbi:alginate lyase family protein [Catenovulum agarivorans]|uniref:alginate lyase family protein n=1 Tax=Catenovulum agarivorans TaxID=1172192 RepID=UPI00030ADCC0|nr:alginate lyase family protein [Catenovulum agarivorans]